jgi:hypothetical protein
MQKCPFQEEVEQFIRGDGLFADITGDVDDLGGRPPRPSSQDGSRRAALTGSVLDPRVFFLLEFESRLASCLLFVYLMYSI